MLISQFLHNITNEALNNLFKANGIDTSKAPNFTIEKPKNKDFGDYATSLPLQISKLFSKKPSELAEIIIDLLPPTEEIDEYSFAHPGFINFKLSNKWLNNELINIVKLTTNYGKYLGSKNQNIQVEFVSVNPTGRLHLGHIRGAVIGSTVSNVLENQNFSVTREYYVNDAGNQMDNFCKSIIERIKQINKKPFNITEDHYKGEDIVEIAKGLASTYKSTNFNDISGELFEEIKQKGMEICISNIKSDLSLLDINHDNWFYESSLIKSNYLKDTLHKLDELDLTYNKDGALWIKTEELGDDRDNVLIKSNDKKPTYFATDIAYHRNKFEERKFNKVINLWGADHHGHIKRMELILDKLGNNSRNLKVLLNQIVSLKSSSGTSKFSKREGNSIYIKDLIEDIGSDACRFSFLNRSADSQMEIDVDIFKKQSSENPVFYIQYAHARMCSILNSSADFNASGSGADPNLLSNQDEITLIKKLLEYPEMLHRVSLTLNVHELPSFSLDLAQLIHKFYEKNRVIDKDLNNIEITKSRLLLVNASKIILSNLLRLMGMKSPEKM